MDLFCLLATPPLKLTGEFFLCIGSIKRGQYPDFFETLTSSLENLKSSTWANTANPSFTSRLKFEILSTTSPLLPLSMPACSNR